jgi:UDP-N-acetylmuramoylalanine--D-glutamate ligase
MQMCKKNGSKRALFVIETIVLHWITSMSDVCEPFRHKKITLLGLGLLGRGVGDAAFLAECGADIIVSDKKSAEDLAPSVEKLQKYPSITFHLGEQPLEDFHGRDLIIKAAGVPQDSPYISVAREAGIPVVMSTALFAAHARKMGATLIGVTGTRGKSTVTQMIYHALKSAGKSTHLGGNVRGLSTLALLPEIQSDDFVVLELDSWQLQGFGDMGLSPDVAVFTNLMPDHMNYYGGSMEKYFADKALIFRNQKAGELLVVGAGVEPLVIAAGSPTTPVVPEPLPEEWKLAIPGDHNRENAALARAALDPFLTDAEIRAGLESFTALEGRLQFVREVNGIKIYNDNNATTPEATIVALKALGTNVVLIAGGSDKNLDLTQLIIEINSSCKRLILLEGKGTDALLQAAGSRLQAKTIGPCNSLAEAFDEAVQTAVPGDTILFSPGFASFGMFKNEYERNDQFLALVEAL